MAKTQDYIMSRDGLTTTVSDTTDWTGPDGPRSNYAIIGALLKYSTSGFSPCVSEGTDNVNINDENPSFIFRNKSDGFYRARTIYASINSAPSEQGAVFYNSSDQSLNLYDNGSFRVVSYSELVTYQGDLLDEVLTDIGFSPTLEKAIDKIWYEYFVTRQIHEGKDYKNFSLLYALLVGANSSLAEGAFVEYDSKIQNANKIALRKLKEIK